MEHIKVTSVIEYKNTMDIFDNWPPTQNVIAYSPRKANQLYKFMHYTISILLCI